MTLEARLKRLEKVTHKERIIQLWLDYGETKEEAIKKYESENDTKIRAEEKITFISWIG